MQRNRRDRGGTKLEILKGIGSGEATTAPDMMTHLGMASTKSIHVHLEDLRAGKFITPSGEERGVGGRIVWALTAKGKRAVEEGWLGLGMTRSSEQKYMEQMSRLRVRVCALEKLITELQLRLTDGQS